MAYPSQILCSRCDYPASIHTTRQHLTYVFAYFLLDHLCEFRVHCQEQIAVFLCIQCEVVQLLRIRLQIEKLHIVKLEKLFQRIREIMLLGREVTAELIAPIKDASDGASFRQVRLHP